MTEERREKDGRLTPKISRSNKISSFQEQLAEVQRELARLREENQVLRENENRNNQGGTEEFFSYFFDFFMSDSL